jgi:hypothetical protein
MTTNAQAQSPETTTFATLKTPARLSDCAQQRLEESATLLWPLRQSLLEREGALLTSLRGGEPQVPGVGVVSSVLPLRLRLGAMISPRGKFLAGVDYTLPAIGGSNFRVRLDAEVIFSANFAGTRTLYPLTANAVYSKGLLGGTRLYGGLGIGPYLGEVTRFGGKVFVGADLVSRVGVEVGVHFSGSGEPLVTGLVRLGL